MKKYRRHIKSCKKLLRSEYWFTTNYYGPWAYLHHNAKRGNEKNTRAQSLQYKPTFYKRLKQPTASSVASTKTNSRRRGVKGVTAYHQGTGRRNNEAQGHLTRWRMLQSHGVRNLRYQWPTRDKFYLLARTKPHNYRLL